MGVGAGSLGVGGGGASLVVGGGGGVVAGIEVGGNVVGTGFEGEGEEGDGGGGAAVDVGAGAGGLEGALPFCWKTLRALIDQYASLKSPPLLAT